jgi:translation initiation factor IF-2
MSRIRIHELAKEVGMASKVLVEKLIDLGYDIKGYSSTVDEDVANDIRSKVLGNVTTEVVEKRISSQGGATVIRRRTRVRRQAAPVEPPEPEEKPTVEEAEEPPVEHAAAPVIEEPVEPEKEEVQADQQVQEEVEEEEATPEGIAEQEAEKETEVEVAEEVSGEGDLEEAETVAEEPEVQEEPEPEKEAEPEPEKKVVKPKPRKGLAKIIKKAAIEIPVEEPQARPSKPRHARHEKRRSGVSAVAAGIADQQVDVTKVATGKGKKKGKRLVQIQADGERGADRPRKTQKKKGRRIVDFSGGYREFDRFPKKGKGKKKKEAASPAAETKAIKKRITVFETITVGDLAHRMSRKASEVIAKLMGLGVMATMNQALDFDTAVLVAADFGYEVEQGITEEDTVLSMDEQEAGGEPLPRPPVVTVMGHVDHGKTSILDAIRKTDVADGEAGGITQHIGAYYVRSSSGDVVFLDTPGHAAFTEMRSRGAKVTDIVVLVVAADDGVMDQTKEAINHAQAAQVPIVVAVNKIDKPNADPSRVIRELAELNLVPEEWGGDVIFCETSAKKNIGLDNLLSNILLQAEILELKADPLRKAKGRVVEAHLHKGRGPVATVLVQEGTLRTGDPFVVGMYSGKVRSLTNDKGELIDEAGPAMPVEVQGLTGVPLAGDEFVVVTDEKMAKNVSASRQLKAREIELAADSKISLDNLFDHLQKAEVKELRVVLRSDVQGTLEAFGKAIEKLSTDEIKVKVLHAGTGTITESDVLLASASDAIIIGFNVRPSVKVKDVAAKESVDIRFYDVIYHALEDIEKAMVGMLEPTFEERVIGTAEVRETFSVPKIGTIAGCSVQDGKIERNAQARLIRDGVVIYTGVISSLRRFKDDVKEVVKGYECGIGIENFNDIKVGDVIEAFLMDEVAGVL